MKGFSTPTPARIVVAVLLLPVFALYGIYVALAEAAALVAGLGRSRAALADTLPCPHGHPNATVGRFTCASCHATYLGWVGRCAICGAAAGWMPCEVCDVSIPLPWERP